jgi:hypothetical protein
MVAVAVHEQDRGLALGRRRALLRGCPRAELRRGQRGERTPQQISARQGHDGIGSVRGANGRMFMWAPHCKR